MRDPTSETVFPFSVSREAMTVSGTCLFSIVWVGGCVSRYVLTVAPECNGKSGNVLSIPFFNKPKTFMKDTACLSWRKESKTAS